MLSNENSSPRKINKRTMWIVHAIIITVNVFNVLLVIAKSLVAYFSGSYSISTSAIESFADVFVGMLIALQTLASKNSSSRYPRGKKTESLTAIVASCVMITLATINILHSMEALITGNLKPDIDQGHGWVLVGNIFAKLLLALICFGKREFEEIDVLYRDQVTDVATNIIALGSTALVYYVADWTDFAGAVVIYAVILFNWGKMIIKSWPRLQGVEPSAKGIKEIADAVGAIVPLYSHFLNYTAYHVGSTCIVEIFGTLIDESAENRRAICEQVMVCNRIATVYLLPACDYVPTEESTGESSIEPTSGKEDDKEPSASDDSTITVSERARDEIELLQTV